MPNWTGVDNSGHLRTQLLHLLHDLHVVARGKSWPAAPEFLLMSFLTRMLIASILTKQNQFLMAEIAYLRAEVDFYREHVPRPSRHLTLGWRCRFARLGEAVGWERLTALATVARGETIRRWHRLMAAGKLAVPRQGRGRPRTSAETEALVLRMARENHWGQIRIVGELKKLGVVICARTVAAILKRHGVPPVPTRERDSTWKPFLAGHAHEIAATDFFTWDVWTWLGKKTVYVLFAIHAATRRVEIMGITDRPDTRFMVQTARSATMEDGWLRRIGAKYLIHDRDTKYSAAWRHVLKEAGVEPLAIPANSPNLNAFAERWVRTVKRECLRQVHVLGMGGLGRVLAEYVAHYHAERPHQGLGNRPVETAANPPAQKIISAEVGEIACRTSCGGVVRHYYRAAA